MREVGSSKNTAQNSTNGRHNHYPPMPEGIVLGDWYKTPPDHKVSYEEFLDWADEDTLAEWVDGEIVMTSPASLKHQDIMGFLHLVCGLYVQVNNLGKIILPPFQMKLPRSGREPDMLFVKKERLGLLGNSFIRGPADLVVEIISPESVERDRENKFVEYAAGGVREFWFLDSTRNVAEFYLLDGQGQFQLQALDAAGKYQCAAIAGLWLRPEWLWQQPQPNVIEVLKQIDPLHFA